MSAASGGFGAWEASGAGGSSRGLLAEALRVHRVGSVCTAWAPCAQGGLRVHSVGQARSWGRTSGQADLPNVSKPSCGPAAAHFLRYFISRAPAEQ